MTSNLFRELEVLELPTGEKYEVQPLKAKELGMLFDLQEELQKIQDMEDEKKRTKLMIKDLYPVALKVIQGSIRNVEGDNELPEKYINISNLMGLIEKVMKASNPTGKVVKEGETPLGAEMKQ